MRLVDAGLKVDEEGDDWLLIQELIEPPKKKLRELLERGQLKSEWSKLMKGRRVEKAWMYDIVT